MLPCNRVNQPTQVRYNSRESVYLASNNRMCFVIGLLILAIYMFVRGANAASRSRKVAIFSLASAIAAFAPIGYVANFMTAPQDRSFLLIGGALGAVVAMAGIVFAIWTLAIRQRDRGVGVALPVVGLVCSLGGLFCG